jgi:hypothetical protein
MTLDIYLIVLQRQFHRLVEMLILMRLDSNDARSARAFRLQVKERLYRFNYVSHIRYDIILGWSANLKGRKYWFNWINRREW